MKSASALSWLLPNRVLSIEKARSAPAEFVAIANAISAASLQAPTSVAWFFHQVRIPAVKSPTSPWSIVNPADAATYRFRSRWSSAMRTGRAPKGTVTSRRATCAAMMSFSSMNEGSKSWGSSQISYGCTQL